MTKNGQGKKHFRELMVGVNQYVYRSCTSGFRAGNLKPEWCVG